MRENDYKDEYANGAKRINIRTNKPRIKKSSMEFTLEKSFGNYDLIFCADGKLLESLHYENNNCKRVTYAYNEQAELSTLLSTTLTGRFIELKTLFYFPDGRLRLEKISGSVENPEEITEVFYEYSKNYKKISYTGKNYTDDEDIENHSFEIFELADSYGRVIEEKIIKNGDEFFMRDQFFYDDNGKLIKKFSLNEQGEIEWRCEYLEDDTAETTVIMENDKWIIRKTEIKKNNKGHWIERALFVDGEPHRFTTREIEYY